MMLKAKLFLEIYLLPFVCLRAKKTRWVEFPTSIKKETGGIRSRAKMLFQQSYTTSCPLLMMR